MGSVPNVGLMAQAAEEYGSHDKTLRCRPLARCASSTRQARADEHDVEAGDIWRACQTKDVPVRDWVSSRSAGAARRSPRGLLARRVPRPRCEGDRQVGRLPARPRHTGLEIQILSPTRHGRHAGGIRRAETISVTGDVPREGLTDLFPILQLGTSAKISRSRRLSTARAFRPCRRLAPKTRSSCSRRTTCGGTAWVSSSPWQSRSASTTSPRHRTPGCSGSPRPGHPHVPRPEQNSRATGRLHRRPWVALLHRALLGPGGPGRTRTRGAGSGFRPGLLQGAGGAGVSPHHRGPTPPPSRGTPPSSAATTGPTGEDPAVMRPSAAFNDALASL